MSIEARVVSAVRHLDVAGVGERLSGAVAGHEVASRQLADAIETFTRRGTSTELVTGFFGRQRPTEVVTPAPIESLQGDVRSTLLRYDESGARATAAVTGLAELEARMAVIRNTRAALMTAIDDSVRGVQLSGLPETNQVALRTSLEDLRPVVDVDAAQPFERLTGTTSWEPTVRRGELSTFPRGTRWTGTYTVEHATPPAERVVELRRAVEDQVGGATSEVNVPHRLTLHSTADTPYGRGTSNPLVKEVTEGQMFDPVHQEMSTLPGAVRLAAPPLWSPLTVALRADAHKLAAYLDGPGMLATTAASLDDTALSMQVLKSALSAGRDAGDDAVLDAAAASSAYSDVYRRLALS